MPIPSKYSSDVPLAPAHERRIPTQWLGLTMSQLEQIRSSIGCIIPDDWISHRVKELRLLKLIDPDNPLCK